MVFSLIWVELPSFRFDMVVDVFLWGKTVLHFVRGFNVSTRGGKELRELLGSADHSDHELQVGNSRCRV